MGLCRCPHPDPRPRSPLCRAVAAAQRPGSTLQCAASMSSSQLGSTDRTQCSPEIWLIGWRFFIALYQSDGSEGLAGTREAESCVLHCQHPSGAGHRAAAAGGPGPGQGQQGSLCGLCICVCWHGCEPPVQHVCVHTTVLTPEGGLHMHLEGGPQPHGSIRGSRGHHGGQQSMALLPL